MKILFCIGNLNRGGAERVISNLANCFVEKNDISIVTTINKVEYNLDSRIKHYSLDYKIKSKLLNKVLRLKKLYSIVKEVKPDIIVSFLPEPSYRVLLLRKIIKIPIIVSIRNDPKTEYSNFKSKCLAKLLYPLADGFVFQTEEAKHYFSNKIQNKSVVIPNPIKKEFLERKIYTGSKENIIVSVGRLYEQKNHELLIDAFYDLNKDIEGYKLIIYGEGVLRKRLENKIQKLNMQDRILLPGSINNIIEKIEKAKLFVMTSNYEGMPNALMEALALGLICISTDCPCGGPKFLIEDNKNGFLFKVKDKDELVKIMKKVLNELTLNQLDEISTNAKQSVQNLSEEKINIKWYDFIKKISNSR